MKSKAPLALMEQGIMILVFALAAALCLRVFALSDQISRSNEARDQAVLQAECAAETLKQVRGSLSQAVSLMGGTCTEEVWSISYGTDWQISQEEAAYQLQASPQDSPTPLLGSALIQVTQGEKLLFSLPVSWQEVADHG